MKHIYLPSIANANLQNTINISIILHYVRERVSTYRSRISKDLGLSLPAVSRAVNTLIERNLLIEKKIITKTGKQAHEVAINASYGYVVGISVELPTIKFSRMDMAGKILDTTSVAITTDIQELEPFILQHMHEYLKEGIFLDEKEIPVIAICLGLSAAVDTKRNRINAVLFQRLNGFDLQKMLEHDFTVPVYLQNDENLAALAEKFHEDGVEEEIFAYIAVHQGIGAGLMIDNHLYMGANGAAGEIGYQHLSLPSRYEDVKARTFERIASIHHIDKIAMEMIQDGKGEELFKAANYSYENLNHVLVSKLAAQGAEDAIQVLTTYARLLAVGLSNFIVSTNPECIILGGALCEIAEVEQYLIDPMVEYIQELIPFPAPKIMMTRFDRDVVVIGAAQYALENAILQDYPYMLKDDL